MLDWKNMPYTPKQVLGADESRRLEDFVVSTYSSRREYANDYLKRLENLSDFLDGHWRIEFPDGRVIVDTPKIENTALTKIEDTGYLAGNIIPNLSVQARHERDVAPSELRERILRYYWQHSALPLLLPRWFMDMVASGMYGIQVWPDFARPKEERFPVYKRLDPRTILPPLDHAIEGHVEPNDVMVHKTQKVRALALKYPDKMGQLMSMAEKINGSASRWGPKKVIADTTNAEVVEFWGKDQIMRIAMIPNFRENYVVLESEVNTTGRCPIVLGFRPTWGSAIKGKVEGMIPTLTAQNRLMTYILDYGDQLVYSPLFKKGNVQNAEDYGPNAMIEGDENSDLTRVGPPPLQSSIFGVLGELQQSTYRSGNQPPGRRGEADQSIISGTGVESLMGGLSTEIQAYQTTMAESLRRANEIAQIQDRTWCDARKTIAGLAKGGSYRDTYVPSMALRDTSNFVSYGAGSGMDKQNLQVRMDQKVRGGYASQRWFRENDPDIEDATEQENRILDEKMLEATMQFALQAAAQGDPEPLKAIQQARKEGQSPLEIVANLAKAAPVAPAGAAPEMPVAPGGNAATEALALQKGGLPGASPNLPPLNELGIGPA